MYSFLPFVFFASLLIFAASVEAENALGGQFVSPLRAGPASDFAENPVWKIGEIRTIQWNTSLSNYTITLWQQVSTTTRRGPTILDTKCDVLTGRQITQFEWTVQSYELDLSVSPVFFLRLVSSIDTANTTSHYFNISSSEATLPATSMPTLYTSTSTPTSTSVVATSTTAPVPAGGMITACAEPSIATASPSSTTFPLNITISNNPTLCSTQASSATTSQLPKASTPSSDSTMGRSVAVICGIGLLCIGGLYIFWRLNQRRISQLQLHGRQQREHWPRLTILNVSGDSFRGRLRSISSNFVSELSSEPRPPVELESQRPAAELSRDERRDAAGRQS